MTKKKTRPSVQAPVETILPILTVEPLVLEPEPSKVSIKSLPVGSCFEFEGVLFRKAFPVSEGKQVGQRLVRHQFSATLLLGPASSFNSDTLVLPK